MKSFPRANSRPRIVITAGGTIEPIDPVRFIGNRSSGKMGISLLRAGLKRRYPCVLIYANLSIPLPPGRYDAIKAETAGEMLRQLRKTLSPDSVLIMAAAVADFRPVKAAGHKIKKKDSAGKLILELKPTTDILKALNAGGRPGYVVMFSAETRDLMRNSLAKMKAKNADLLVANDVSRPDSGFGSDFNEAVIVTRSGRTIKTGRLSKDMLAGIILDTIEKERG